MKRRGYRTNFDPETIRLFFQTKLMDKNLGGYWQPTQEAMAINRARIAERLFKNV